MSQPMGSGRRADPAIARVGCAAERMAQGAERILEERRPGEEAVGCHLRVSGRCTPGIGGAERSAEGQVLKARVGV